MKPGAWAELLRISALFTVPGDALAGAAAAGLRPGRGTAYAVGASLCLYEAGMALNDWADRAEDAIDRPHRPIPSGRVTPRAALATAGALTAAGLALSARAGRPALAVATALAGTVWAYDLKLKHTPAGPAAMAAARALDLMLGATATGRAGPARPGEGHGTRRARHAWGAAALLATHTYAVTSVSRHETHGGSTAVPIAALAATVALGCAAVRSGGTSAPTATATASAVTAAASAVTAAASAVTAAGYLGTAAKPYLHAALNPSPALTQQAVGGGIRAMIPLQSALAARAGAPGTAAALLALAPLARTLARKVSPT
ncbi:SCO3242 family prenyltransferase [Streptomyces sp. NBC_01766]|uniref:SCO3242 family prenyltransferase n=1 Tax=Streptomyces sp. NBC_01766 TaxID=2975936 RepID=UPI002DDBCBC8|nr:UbiA family prenyltransferase [Streptomyces sp. NBC_01766]WSC18802.1 UbiA family prenyltransferase [Streptomyces sp. NBC_01766]